MTYYHVSRSAGSQGNHTHTYINNTWNTSENSDPGGRIRDSCSSSSSSEESSLDLTGDEVENKIVNIGDIRGYQFEPVFPNGERDDENSGSSRVIIPRLSTL